ncbi:MAG: ATP-binding cassette domain-containing protein [Bacilli bacterium]
MNSIEIKKLNKSYYIGSDEFKVLKDLNVSFNYGEFIAIYGESGSGKSTFMNVLGGLDTFDSGEILINNENISKFTSKSMDYYRNRKIGFIFQEFKLLENLTLLENVMMPMNIAGVGAKQAKDRAIKLLEQVGLKDHIKKRAKNLSGGQKQRVAIARALANDPEIILADEPTGALDSQTTIEILELLKSIADSGKLVIAITHSEEVAKYGNRVITLIDGKFEEEVGESVSVDRSANELPTKKENSRLSFRKAFKIARTNLFSKKFRTLLVSLGVSLGITGALVITSISESAIDEVVKVFSTYDMVPEHVGVLIEKESNNTGVINVRTGEVNLDEEVDALKELLKDYEGFDDIYPEYILVATDPENPDGLDAVNYFGSVSYLTSDDIKMKYGDFPTNERELYYSGSSYGISYLLDLVGKNDKFSSEDLNEVDFVNKNDKYYELEKVIEEEVIGSKFTVSIDGQETEFTITGSLALGNSSLTTTDLILPAETNKDYIEDNKYSFVVSRYFAGFETEEDALVLVDELGRTGTISNTYNDYIVTAQDYRSLAIIAEYMLEIIRNVFLVLMSVSLIVSMFMVNIIVYISTLERKVEIGTLRAIGAKKNNITAIFISEGIWIGIFSFILACIGSYLMIVLVNAILYFALDMPTFNTIVFSLKWLLIIASLVFAVMFSASILPAKKASKQNPIDALREE